MSETLFVDCIVLCNCSDPVHNAKAALQKRLEKYGARIVSRLTKEVTHIVFERSRSGRAIDKKEDEIAIAELYRKIDRMPCPPTILSPLWIEESIQQGRRLIENRYMISRPKSTVLNTANLSGHKRKTRSSLGPAPPRPTEEFDIGGAEWLFCSEHQLRGTHTMSEDHDTESPNKVAGSAPKRLSRLHRSRSSAATNQLATKGTNLRSNSASTTDAVLPGPSTQAVADILAIDLPADQDLDGMDDLELPLSARCIRRSSGKRQRVIQEVENDEGDTKDNGPKNEQEQRDDENDEEENGKPRRKTRTSSNNNNARKSSKQKNQVPKLPTRYSRRNLHPERQLKLHKGTPFNPIKPMATKRSNGQVDAIPIPDAVRVASPWNEPTPQTVLRTNPRTITSARPRVSFGGLPTVERPFMGNATHPVASPTLPTTIKKVVCKDHVPNAWSPREWDGTTYNTDLKKPIQRRTSNAATMCRVGPGRSRFGTQNDDMAAKSSQQDTEEQQKAAEEAAPMVDATQEEFQIPFGIADTHTDGTDTNDDDDHHQNHDENACVNKQQQQEEEPKTENRKRGKAPSRVAPPGSVGLYHGFIAYTSVASGIPTLAKSATQRLRGGLRMCTDGKEDGAITHLVIGEERRTLKTMLAVANGALLVRPEWISASIENGSWLDPEQFKSNCRFAPAADRAREHLSLPNAKKLLEDHSLHIVPGDGNAAALKRIAVALGARCVSSPKECSVCIIAGKEGSRPTGLSLPQGVPLVTDEWLLRAAENYAVPPFRKHALR